MLVSDLAAYYNVTEETIRRDLDKLEKEGFATKTYGGAILGNSTKTDLSYTIRNKTNVDAKTQIAELVSTLIDDGDHLMLDDSSTSLYIARRLKEKKGLTVITNSVELVVELANAESWTIMLTGGRLKAESLALQKRYGHRRRPTPFRRFILRSFPSDRERAHRPAQKTASTDPGDIYW